MAKAEASVEELVGMIERGELRLPEMQRQYVWKSTRVRDLLDSLYRGYPSGAILLWETDEPVSLQEFAVSQQSNPYKTTRLLLDGQQRLTSLSAVIRGEPIQVMGRKRPIDMLFNLDHPDAPDSVFEDDEEREEEEGDDDEESDMGDETSDDEMQRRFDQMTFVVATKKLAQRPSWVNVSDVFKSDSDADILKKAGVSSFDDPRYKKYTQRLSRLRAIKKYVYRMDVLERKLSYAEVTDIFVRVNSLGAKLKSSDLALAQITSTWRGSLEVFQRTQSDFEKSGYLLDLSIHLRSLMSFATGQCKFNAAGKLGLNDLQISWEVSVGAMQYAVNFLKSNVGIHFSALLASPHVVVTLANFGHSKKFKISRDESDLLKRWVLLVNAKGRYSRGSSDTLLDQDLATIRGGGGVDALIDRLRTQVGRLDVTPEELAGRNRRSSLFKTMFLAFKNAGAKDWKTQLVIDLSHKGSTHSLQFHHIFPKAVLKGRYPPRDADDIANLAFIGGKTNRQISDKPPIEYFSGVLESSGQDALTSQCIPVDENLLKVENYRDFISERRKMIANRLNDYLGFESS